MHCRDFLNETRDIAIELDAVPIEALATELSRLRDRGGRLYIIGLGGSMANVIHMAADLQKLCEVDAQAMDNIAELTARANDEGLDTIFTGWLRNLSSLDALLVLSVGGGTATVSKAITRAVAFAKNRDVRIFGILGPNGGYTGEHADISIRIPVRNRITPHTEAFQAVVWHALVSHPLLQRHFTVW